MRFAYDPEKSAANKAKHGIDFDEAQTLWSDPWLAEIPARTADEPRFLAIGKIGDTHWAAVFAHRDRHIRLISVRRARREEIAVYEGT